jgi:hypothetical protein
MEHQVVFDDLSSRHAIRHGHNRLTAGMCSWGRDEREGRDAGEEDISSLVAETAYRVEVDAGRLAGHATHV